MSRMLSRLVALLATAVGVMPGQAGAAESCKLMLAATLPLESSTPDLAIVPAEIDGQASRLVLDTGAPRSQIFTRTGEPAIGQDATIRNLRLGGLDLPHVPFLIRPDSAAKEAAAGRFGMDLLRGYDVELNLAQHRINLFSQDHCTGEVVYWSRSHLSAPIAMGADGRLLVAVTLDGQRFQARIDTGAGHSSIRQAEASRLFGITPQSPYVEVISTTVGASGAMLTTYRAPFRALDLAGVRFHNPAIRVLPDLPRDPLGNDERPGAMMTLGLEELSKLRIYLALKEKVIYLTPAEPDQPT